MTVKPRTVGSRDALYKAAVDAVVAAASSPVDGASQLGAWGCRGGPAVCKGVGFRVLQLRVKGFGGRCITERRGHGVRGASS